MKCTRLGSGRHKYPRLKRGPGMSNLAQTSVLWSVSVKLCSQPNRRGAQESLAALQDRAIVKRTAPIRVISLILLTACGALCQNSLPDAPSAVQPPTQAEFRTFVNEAHSALIRETELGHATPGLQHGFAARYKAVFTQEEPSNFVGKYTSPSLLKPEPRYYASTSDSLVGRATYAASRIFVARDDSGKGKFNTSYFIGVLTSVASATAYRPYWARSTSATFNNVGSTIGSDAGSNLFHEFGPGIRQMVKGHIPMFVSRIGDRIAHDRTSRDVVSTPVR